MLELVTTKQTVTPATDAGLVDFDLNLETAPGVPEGQRHSRACQLIGAHLARGESPLDVLDKVYAWADKCDPPMESSETKRIVRDLDRKDRATALAEQGPWPELDEAALYGVAGEFVKRIEPHTEADPVAILIQLLVFFGNMIGRQAYFVVEATRHYPNLFVVLVGQSAKARKGTSEGHVRDAFYQIDEVWTMDRIKSGLSSGEGVISSVQDPNPQHQGDADTGVGDKRLLIVETEFASPLKVMRREGNTLSPVIRLAWDSGHLGIMTRRNPVRATNAHISIVGHITHEELQRALDDVDVLNGFANRILWTCVKRSKLLPEGGQRPGMSDIVQLLRAAYEHAQSVGELKRDDSARALWGDIYRELAEPLPGFPGVVTSRAEAQLLRLSMLYALLDQRSIITAEHLRAAKALLDYATASAQHIFGRTVGDTLADRVLSILGTGPKSRKEIHKALSGHAKGSELDRVLKDLEQRGLAECQKVGTKGRPAEVWSRT